MTCPTTVGVSDATNLVNSGWSFYSGQANQILHYAIQEAVDLSNLELEPLSYEDVDFSIPPDIRLPVSMSVPSAPALAIPETIVADKPTPLALEVAEVTTKEIPTFDGQAPDKNLPVAPNRPTESVPDAPTVPEREIPDYTAEDTPLLPSLRDIILPSLPDFEVPVFTGVLPSTDGLNAPTSEFDYTDTPFDSELLGTLQTKISTWLAGDEPTGLSETIWAQIWDTGRTRERVTAKAAMDAAMVDWSRRGFTLPGGVIDAKREAQRAKTQEAENGLSREVAVKQAEMEVANMRFAMERGASLVELLYRIHEGQAQRAFAIAQYVFSSAIELSNARIAVYQARLAGYQAEAAVFAERIRAAVLVLEGYKTQLEGQRLIGELNQQDVDLYLAKWQGVKTAVEAYQAQVSAIATAVDADKARVEIYQARVGAYGEVIRAYSADVDAYKARVGAYGTEVEAFGTAVRAYVGQVEGIKAGNDSAVAVAQLANDVNVTKAQHYKAQIDGWAAAMNANSDMLKAQAAIYDGQARIFSAQGQVNSDYTRAEVSRFEAAMEEGKANTSLALEKIKIDVAQVQRLTEFEVQARMKAAETYGQLSAATMSAVNLSAGISSSDNDSKLCQTTYSY